MKHPNSRAARIHARLVSRERYRNRLRLFHRRDPEQPAETHNRYWNRGGKQCEAHGNRCMHSMIPRHDNHMEVKRLRRIDWSLDEY